jgi:simple sugar transport system permease protein
MGVPKFISKYLVIEEREKPSRLINISINLVAVIVSFIIGAIILLVEGFNPIKAYSAVLVGAFGSLYSISETLVKMAPLLFIGLGTALAFKTKFFNLGGEGQLFAGAMTSTFIALFIPGIDPIRIPLALIMSFVMGGLVSLLSATLKMKLGVSEVVTTIMLNYIMYQTAKFLIFTIWRDPNQLAMPVTAAFPLSAMLPKLIPRTRLHAGLIIALAFVPIIYFILTRTRLGFKIKCVGMNPMAARYAGINITNTVLLVSVISGGLAGLAGFGEVCGLHGHLREDISLAGLRAVGFGWMGVPIALLAKMDAIGTFIVSLFFSALIVGGQNMQIKLGINAYLMAIIQSLILLCVILFEVFTRYNIRLRRT